MRESVGCRPLVGSRTGAVPHRLGVTVGPSPAPARANGACGFPARALLAGPASHVATNSTRRHEEAELQEQFRGDPLLAPRRIAAGHGRDQTLEVRREARPPGPGPPAPERAKGLPVPSEESPGLEDRQDLTPGEAPSQQNQPEPHGIRRGRGCTCRSRYKANCFRRKRFSAARAVRDRRLVP